ncbi:hypothetical protein Val02_11770 [Virgisporangium aliadipatigenens]|uniref:Uncharacterized protein n=1 Tax=Virgisporangium aliadipatigenens TaxID=741659 RepID=A0A8J4DNY0_9ACTN|nr:hypothetical protein [Virgisporangium aliadipatigenens]GIJ44291.1 hypothetical protein Val02_11770 [Virgisporangium aliadipatigenens]
MRYDWETRGDLVLIGGFLYGFVLLCPVGLVAATVDEPPWWYVFLPVALGALLAFLFPGPLLRFLDEEPGPVWRRARPDEEWGAGLPEHGGTDSGGDGGHDFGGDGGD